MALGSNQMFKRHFAIALFPNQAACSTSSLTCFTVSGSNYVFKPTAEEVARIIHTPSRGGGLTRR